MAEPHKRQTRMTALIALFLLSGLVVCLSRIRTPRAPLDADVVKIRFAGYLHATNSPDSYALFIISNQAPYAIRWCGDSVEIEGRPDRLGRTFNPTVPYARLQAKELAPGASMKLTAGEPFYNGEITGRWRLVFEFLRYDPEARWLDYSSTNKQVRWLKPLVNVDSQSVLSPTNRAIATSEWLTKIVQ